MVLIDLVLLFYIEIGYIVMYFIYVDLELLRCVVFDVYLCMVICIEIVSGFGVIFCVMNDVMFDMVFELDEMIVVCIV